MDKDRKIEFVKSLLRSVEDELVSKIENNCIPENWDGFELRWYLSEIVENATMSAKLHKKRYSDFKNDIIIRDL